MPNVYINASEEAAAAMLEFPQDQPVDMLNMIRFKQKAEYPVDSAFAQKNWSGQQAYAEYGRHTSPIIAKLGSKVEYNGVPQLTVVGPDSEKWDAIFVVRYPNIVAFLSLINDAEYQKHVFHRSAAVADSRLYRLAAQ